MTTGDICVTLNDIEADAVPVRESRMDPDGQHPGSSAFPPDINVQVPEANVTKVPNCKLWQKNRGDFGLDFLKSLWDSSSPLSQGCLESQVSVDGEKKSFSKVQSDTEGEFFQNDLICGNRSPKKASPSTSKSRGGNSEKQTQKTDRARILNNVEGTQSSLPDKPKRSAPTKPPRAASGKFPESYKDVKDILFDDLESSDDFSELNYSEDDMLPSVCILHDPEGGDLIIINNGDNDPTSSFDDVNFDVKERGDYEVEHQNFEGSNVESPKSKGRTPGGSEGEGHKERMGDKSNRVSPGNLWTQDAGNIRSFEADANLPREMLPPPSEGKGHRSERGDNPEVNPFINTFSEEITYNNSGVMGDYSSELPSRGAHGSHEQSDTCHHGNAMPTRNTARNPQQGRQTLLMGNYKGCGNCQNCRATKMIDHMEQLADSAGFDIHDVLPDGNCMFRAIVDQLRMRGVLTMTAGKLRQNVVQYLRENPCSEDGTHMQMFLPTEKWEDYLTRMEKDGEWGDEMALRGISEVLQRHINIISAIGNDQHNQITIQPTGVEPDQSQDLFLGHMDDYHYISLRPKNWEDTWFVRARQNQQQTKAKADPYTDDSIRVSGMDAPIVGHDCVDDYFVDDAAVDTVSSTPIGHLSFILKNVLNTKYLVVQDPEAWDEKVAMINNYPQSDTVITAVGSIVEKMEVSLRDTSPVQIGYSLRKDKSLTSSLKDITPKFLIHNPYYHVTETDIDESQHSRKHMVIDTSGVRPGYLRLRETIKPSNITRQGQVFAHFLPNSSLKGSGLSRQLRSSGITKVMEETLRLEYAFECQFWPECAAEWITRARPSGWPKPEFRKNIIEDGVFIISGFHPRSSNPELEYQFCFGKAEKLLSRRNMTKWQRYCFHIFKVVVDFHTRQTQLLQTYYLRTVFFYASEVVPRIQWRLNPGASLLYLMDKLLQCLRAKKLPHYFIHDSNLIDHFNDDALQRIITHLEAVRQFPVTAIVLLAESHGLTSSWMSDSIIEDIPDFTKHRDLQKAFAEVFIPTTLKNAINFVKYMMLKPAADVIMEAYEDMRSASTTTPNSTNEWGVCDIFEFIHQILSELHFFQQFWLCLVLDLTHDTSTLTPLTQRLPGKTIREILGNGEEGELDNVSVPFSVMSSCCSAKAQDDEADPEITFVQNLGNHLVNIQHYDLAAHYLRAAISLMKRRIAEITKSGQMSTKEGDQRNIGTQSPKLNSADFSRLHTIKMHLNNFLVQLFNCYHYDGQTELFQEYVEDLQEVCDSISTPYAYRNLSRIWGYLGCNDKAQQASDRMEELFQLCAM